MSSEMNRTWYGHENGDFGVYNGCGGDVHD